MSWAKLDDQIHKNRKLLACTPAARWLYIALITYSRDAQTGGEFSRGEMASVAGGQGCKGSHVNELLGAGLVIDVDPFFEIKDYEEFNPLTSKERTRRYREKHSGDINGDGVRDDRVTSQDESPPRHSHARAPAHRATPSPSPLPVRELSLVSNVSLNTPEALAICHVFEGLGGVITPKALEDAEGLVAEFRIPSADEFTRAMLDGVPSKAIRTLLYFRQRFRELNDELRDAGRKPRDHDWAGRMDGFGA